MNLLSQLPSQGCPCGKAHLTSLRAVVTGKGALSSLPEQIRALGAGSVFLLSDRPLRPLLDQRVFPLLREHGIVFSSHVFEREEVRPDETAVGEAFLHLDRSAELIVGVGSGVVNDIGKLLAAVTGRPYLIVATAPSMDGYASATSSMTRGGLKVSLPTKLPDVVIGDTDILKEAPMKCLRSGLGDMLAKYVSIAEWRLSHLINGEYYCEAIASLIRRAVKACVEHADGLLRREERAVEAVFDGLLLAGLCMNYAGVSRPASGVEHYLSHLLDMRSAAFGTPEERHGIQCAAATCLAVRAYEKLAAVTPDRDKALFAASHFDFASHAAFLRELVGKGAAPMIEAEALDGKYDPVKHRDRLDRILTLWPQLLAVIKEELPSAAFLTSFCRRVGLPTSLSELGVDDALFPSLLRATADVRDKYVLSRLLWDLGIASEDLC